MENMNASIVNANNVDLGNAVIAVDNTNGMDNVREHIDDMLTKVDKLEQRVSEVEQFYLHLSKNQSSGPTSSLPMKDKDKVKHVPSIKKQQQDATRREAAASKRMQELMRQFGTIIRQITQHKWAWPFMQPVDVEGLGLHDYYQIIDRPMDFSTIKNQMEARDGTGYRHVRDICSDVRLVFTNAMKYNDEKSDVHVMAKTLLAKFEEKWLHFLPKVTEEEKRREEEEAEAQLNMQLAQEAAHAKLTRDLSDELHELDVHLEELREKTVNNCRKMSTEEKRNLGVALSKLCLDDFSKALEIVAQNNPSFQLRSEELELDIDAQAESTLWRLNFFVKDALEAHHKSVDINGNTNNENQNTEPAITRNAKFKRKRNISDALCQECQEKE